MTSVVAFAVALGCVVAIIGLMLTLMFLAEALKKTHGPKKRSPEAIWPPEPPTSPSKRPGTRGWAKYFAPRLPARRDDSGAAWRDEIDSLKSKGSFDRKAASRLLRHSDPEARKTAARRLAELGRPDATRALLKALRASRKARRREDPSEGEVQLETVRALGAVGDERALPAIFDCMPVCEPYLLEGPRVDWAERALLDVVRRSGGGARKWLATVRGHSNPEKASVIAVALATVSDPGALEALEKALRLVADDWQRVWLVRTTASLGDARAVPILLDQAGKFHLKGGHRLEEALGELLALDLAALPLKTLFELATVLPSFSAPLSGSPLPGGPVFMDGVRRAGLDELEVRGVPLLGVREDAEAEVPDAETTAAFGPLLESLTAEALREKEARKEGVRLVDGQAEELEAEMVSFLEHSGKGLLPRHLAHILRLPVERRLIAVVLERLHLERPGSQR